MKLVISADHAGFPLKEDVRDYSELATMLVSSGQKLMTFKEDELNLEGAFMALTKGITS